MGAKLNIMRKQTKEFVRLVTNYLDGVHDMTEFNATNVVKEDYLGYNYVADTVYGSRLFIKADESKGFYSVFTRFEEPEKVKGLPQMSSVGKCNYHVTMEDPEHAADYVIGELASMIEFNESEKELI